MTSKISIKENHNEINLIKSIYNYITIINVKEVSYEFNTNHSQWNLIKYNNITQQNNLLNYYLFIDTKYDDAFAHWVLESAIYLPLFNELKKIYPKLKLCLKNSRTYKKMFCNYFKINDSDIIYNCYSNINTFNMSLFPLPISCCNVTTLNNEWEKQVDYFFSIISKNSLEQTKINNVLFLPRQTKENFSENDRIYDVSDILNKVDNILNTDDILYLEDQIKLVNSSLNVILTGGSPFLINGLLCYNSNIIVIDNMTEHQSKTYKKFKYITDKICKNNKVHFISNKKKFIYEDIVQFLVYS